MNLSIKDRQRYKDIEWLMPSVDVVDVLERLNAESISARGHEIDAMCPDHHMFVERDPSHPRWSCNIDTGETYCFTEPRGSNLFWTVARLLDAKNPNEVVQFMTGKDAGNIRSSLILGKINKMRRGKRLNTKDPVRLDDIKEDMLNRYISDACYGYFMHPSGKNPTNIRRETVDRYQVFERPYGYYSNRAVIPFFMHGELVGFCAIDLLGEKQWILEHPLNDEDDYRKTLYPLNFRSRECLFGYDDVEVGCEHLFVTEGAREVMKLTQESFPAVACLKADLGDEQIMLLTKKAPKEIILFFDGDEAGWSATDKNAKKLERVFRVRKCYLPVGQDPKNFCAEDIKKIIKRSKLT